MTHATPDAVRRALTWRYAVKKFDPRRAIPADVWSALEASLVLTPSSFGLQPWRFVVVTDAALKEQLPPLSWNQTQVRDASHVVVFAVNKKMSEADVDRYVARMAEVRGVAVESLAGFRGVMVRFLADPPQDPVEWAARQAYIALGTFMTTAAFLGVDTCPMEGFEPAKYDALLGLADSGYTSVVVCPAGYRAADDRYAHLPKVRFRPEDVVETR